MPHERIDDDYTLLDAVLRGDTCARNRLVQKYKPVFERAFMRMVRDEALADELVQEMFEAVLADDCRKLRQWQGRSTLKTYLITVSRNLARDRLKSRLYRPLGADEADDQYPEMQEDPAGSNPLTHILAAEIHRAVKHCLDLLRPRDRELVTRRHLQDEQPREIADAMGLNTNSVSAGLTRAGRRMKDCINRRFPGLFRLGPFAPHDDV